MRAEQVAELLAIKTSTVYELSRRRRDPLPYVRIGRSKLQPSGGRTMAPGSSQRVAAVPLAT
jgi:hypothetical protein